jgi:hypothetical protein
MTRRRATVLVLFVGLSVGAGREARAQDVPDISVASAAPIADASTTITADALQADTRAQYATSLLPDVRKAAAAESPRSSMLTFLYGFTAGTQALDIHSTRVALEAGAYESNPFMKKISVHTGGLIATKAAMTVGTIVVVDRIARHHKTTAVVTLIAINAVNLWVAHHNYAVSRSLR